MYKSLRDTRPWWESGGVIGALLGTVIGALSGLNVGLTGLATVLGIILGMSLGFLAFTFVYGIQQFGIRAVGKAAVNSAMMSIVFAPLTHLVGWSNQPLLTDMAYAAAVLAFSGAYLKSADIWMPKIEPTNEMGEMHAD